VDSPVPAVDAVVPPAPSNAPTLNDTPANVVAKMELMESEDVVVIVPHKNFKECVMLSWIALMTKMTIKLPLFPLCTR